MKLAACNEMFSDRSWEDVCRTLVDHGYHGVEIAPFTFASSVREIDGAARARIRETAERFGLEIIGLHWLLAKTEGYYLTHPDPEVRSATARYLVDLVHFCADIGGRVLVFGSPHQRNLLPGVTFDQALEYAAEVLLPACDVAGERGAVIAFEPLAPNETDFGSTADEARKLIERVDQPTLRMHLDAKAMASESKSMAEIVKAHADLLEHVHVNDVNLLGPGMGDLDLWPMISALSEVGYDGYLSVEVFDTTPGPERILEESKAYIEGLLSRLSS